jgi:uncharacterized protein (TIGR02246 family)
MSTRETEERAVRAVIQGVYDAWEKNDADAFVAQYAPSATATLPGSFLCDREAIRAVMRDVFARQLRGSRATYAVQRVRFVGGDVAIVASKGAVTLAGQKKPAPEAHALETWVLSKAEGGWWVQAFHNCPERSA